MPVYYVNNSQRAINELRLKVAIANRLILEDIHKESLFNTPMKSSQLRRDVSKTVDTATYTGTIIWRVPYASYQERGMRADGTHVVRNYTTPGTGKNFAKNAVNKTLSHVWEFYGKVL
jgi:hypothetical protein